MWDPLIDPDPSGHVLAAWIAKGELPTPFVSARTGTPCHVIVVRHDVLYPV